MSALTVYPCDRGTGQPVGWHWFTTSEHGTVCRWCGQKPKEATGGR